MPDVSRIRAQLGAELRAARTLSGMSQRALRASLGDQPSQVTLSRMERGEAIPDRALAARWLTACAASADIRSRVDALIEAAHNETRAWSDMLGDDLHLQGVARIRDEDAALIRNCQVSWVPGLLQTAEYARLLIPQIDPQQKFDHAAMVADRMERQRILYGTGRRFEFLIAEHALTWSPAVEAMPAQLDRLASVATLSSVQLAILPTARVGTPAWQSFIYREAAEDRRSSVTTELVHGGGSITDPDLVGLYRDLWEQMWGAAAVGADARTVLRQLAEGYRGGDGR